MSYLQRLTELPCRLRQPVRVQKDEAPSIVNFSAIEVFDAQKIVAEFYKFISQASKYASFEMQGRLTDNLTVT